MEAGAAASAGPTKRSLWPIIGITVLFTMGAAMASSGLEYDTIMKNWDARRCDLGVMMAARFFKPSDDARTPAEFAKDNFDYCMKRSQDTAIDKTLAPTMALFDTQQRAVKTVQETQAAAEKTLTNFANAFLMQVVRDFYRRLEMFGDQLRLSFNNLQAGFKKIQAAMVSAVFIGLAMVQGILNFYNLVILVVIIILSILAAIFIILIFVLWPFLPMIVGVIAALSAAGFGALVGGLGATFCFPGNTPVRMADGSMKKLKHVQLGERVHGGGVVEGMYMMDGSAATLYMLPAATTGGMPVYVSGDHLIWNSATKQWVYVRDFPGARVAHGRTETVLYCPSIDNRCLQVGGHWFRDWEEIPDAAEDAWEAMVESALNPSSPRAAPVHTRAANGVRGGAKVFTKEGEWVSIQEVQIGDSVLCTSVATGGHDTPKYTKVLGKVFTLERAGAPTYNQLGGGIWQWNHTANAWVHPATATPPAQSLIADTMMYNLITDAGHYDILSGAAIHIIRDAFEVGLDGMAHTYDFTLRTLNCDGADNSPPITE